MFMYYAAVIALFQHINAENLLWSTRTQSILCPVSAVLNATSTGIFSYPTFNREVEPMMHSSSLLTCTALSDYGPEEIQCFSTGGCPLLGLDVGGFSSMNIATNSKNYLCNVVKTLQQDCLNGETVRLIVFGGSVTTGHSTCGCCGRSIPSNVCPYSDVISHRNYSDEDANMNYCSYAIKHAVNLDSEFCNWSAFLYRWLKIISPKCNIRYHNIAYSGMSSKTMAEKVVSILHQDEYNVTNLTASDILLIDYSYNDAAEEDGIGLEDVIRALLSMSIAGAEPAIIILETRKVVPHKIFRVYREVAQHYSIPLWSYREFLHQNMLENRTNYEQLLQVYTLRDHPLFSLHDLGWHHPAWPVHLLWADLIAGGLISTAQNCSDRSAASPGSEGAGAAAQSLPSRLKLQARILSCNLMPSLLDVSAEKFTSSDEGQDTSTWPWASSTWKVEADGPHRTIGWISALLEDEQGVGSLSSEQHAHHGSHNQIITFQPHHATTTPGKSGGSGSNNLTSSTPILVGVDYLKTYLNAGVVDILWCDVLLGSIDSLDSSSRKVSVHDFAKFRTTLVPSAAAGAHHDHDHQQQEQHCKLKITHGKVSYGNLTARGTSQKFKIFSVQICIIPPEL